MADFKKDDKKGKSKPKPSSSPLTFILIIFIVASAISNTRLGKYLLGTSATSTPQVEDVQDKPTVIIGQ